MTYFIVSLIAGMLGGFLVEPFLNRYTLGPIGNIITGFLGGTIVYVLSLYALGGTAYPIVAVGGVFGGVITRSAFTVIRRRMVR